MVPSKWGFDNVDTRYSACGISEAAIEFQVNNIVKCSQETKSLAEEMQSVLDFDLTGGTLGEQIKIVNNAMTTIDGTRGEVGSSLSQSSKHWADYQELTGIKDDDTALFNCEGFKTAYKHAYANQCFQMMYNFGIWSVWISTIAFFSIILSLVSFLSTLYTFLKVRKEAVVEKYEDVIKAKLEILDEIKTSRKTGKSSIKDGIELIMANIAKREAKPKRKIKLVQSNFERNFDDAATVVKVDEIPRKNIHETANGLEIELE